MSAIVLAEYDAARGVHHVRVLVNGHTPGELWFDVSDDGAGDTPVQDGAGITNMRDRLAAIDGSLHLVSRHGIGTCVSGRVPAPA